MSYLKHKPGSIEEMMANKAKVMKDNAYQQMFKKELDKAGKGIGSMSPKEKKDFFNKIDSKYKAKNEITAAQKKLPPALQKAIKDKEDQKEGFASDAQRKAAFASGYKEKGKKEDLDNKDKSVVSKVVTALKKATKAHDGQAKDLEKAMKTEADQHGDEINKKKMDTRDDKSKGEKDIKKIADSGSKATKVETEPKVDYKN